MRQPCRTRSFGRGNPIEITWCKSPNRRKRQRSAPGRAVRTFRGCRGKIRAGRAFRQRGALDPPEDPLIQLLFRYWPRRRHGRVALRSGRPLEQRTVDRNIVRGHARGRKSFFEPSPDGAAIERNHSREHPHRLIHRINDGARDALVDDFRNGALAECKYRCAARHRLDHHQAERLRPIDREQERPRLAQEFGLAALVDLADELDPRVAQQRRDLFAEIGFIDLVDFGGDLQRDAERPCYPNGTIRPLLGRDWPRNAT